MLACTFATPCVQAILNVGAEAGAVKRTAASPDNFNLAIGYGGHADLTFASTFAVGVYYLHSKNDIAGLPSNLDAYEARGITQYKGEFWEAPMGFGIAHQLLRIFQISIEGAYRPSFSFSGAAYDSAGIRQPKSGWSVLAGVALDL